TRGFALRRRPVEGAARGALSAALAACGDKEFRPPAPARRGRRPRGAFGGPCCLRATLPRARVRRSMRRAFEHPLAPALGCAVLCVVYLFARPATADMAAHSY